MNRAPTPGLLACTGLTELLSRSAWVWVAYAGSLFEGPLRRDPTRA